MLYFPYTRPKLANLSVFKSYIRKQPKIGIYAQKKKNKNKNKKQNKTKQKTLHDRRDWKSQLVKIKPNEIIVRIYITWNIKVYDILRKQPNFLSFFLILVTLFQN